MALTVLSCAILPAVLLALELLGIRLPVTAGVAVLSVSIVWIAVVAHCVRGFVLLHLRNLSNLIETTRMQDYSLKASRTREPGELASLYKQINALSDRLRVERQGEKELLGILETVISQINVAIIVCDSRDKILLANLRAFKLLGSPPEAVIGVEFANTPLAEIRFENRPRLLSHRFPGGEGRWQVSQQHYRHQGKPSRIVFITDLQHILSNEEVYAWQRLIKVIGHEVNNSLTPIMSLCQTIAALLERPDSAEYAGDVRDGLAVISSRAKGLKEFITAYARIARLPEPNKILFPAVRLVHRIKSMFASHGLEVIEHVPDMTLFGDPVQLEQVLINLIRNALEAQGERTQAIRFSQRVLKDCCEFEIVDSGTGISNPDNLFVPFYTTKSYGAGIGLILCRQIASRHYGQVTLENRSDAPGAVARLILPLPTQEQTLQPDG